MPEKPEESYSYETYGVQRKQDHRWVRSKMKQHQDQALIKHVMAHHTEEAPPGADGKKVRVRKETLCQWSCGFSAQEICDAMDWSSPSYGSFYYSTSYRNYPRLMKALPHLNHDRYTRMIVGYKAPLEVLAHFAGTGARWLPEYDAVLKERRQGQGSRGQGDPGNAFEEFMSRPLSTRTGMINRWRKNPTLAHIIVLMDVAEVLLG